MRSSPRAPSGKPWFHAKPGGYGSGLPCSWEGWATYALFFIAAAVWGVVSQTNGWLPGGHDSPLGWGVHIALLAVFLVVVRNRTAGGWRAGADGE